MALVACAVCWAPGHDDLPARAKRALVGVVVHRIEVSQEDASYTDTPSEVARFFREHSIGREATGGAMPYPVLIDDAGAVTQCVPLGRTTPHAKTHNPTTIGVGLLGDFRDRAPSARQRGALIQVCASLLRELALPPSALRGHDELEGGSSDPNKECPGRELSLPRLREDVHLAMKDLTTPMTFVW